MGGSKLYSSICTQLQIPNREDSSAQTFDFAHKSPKIGKLPDFQLQILYL